MVQWVYVIDGFHENLAIMAFNKLLTQKSDFSYTCHAIRVLWLLKIYMFIHAPVLNRTTIQHTFLLTNQTKQNKNIGTELYVAKKEKKYLRNQ